MKTRGLPVFWAAVAAAVLGFNVLGVVCYDLAQPVYAAPDEAALVASLTYVLPGVNTGSLTVEKVSGSTKRIRFLWFSSATGTEALQTTNPFEGKVEYVSTNPAADASAPTDNYDISITDESGNDVLAGNGANRDTLNNEYILPGNLGAVAAEKLQLNVSNAGDTKSGEVYVWIR